MISTNAMMIPQRIREDFFSSFCGTNDVGVSSFSSMDIGFSSSAIVCFSDSSGSVDSNVSVVVVSMIGSSTIIASGSSITGFSTTRVSSCVSSTTGCSMIGCSSTKMVVYATSGVSSSTSITVSSNSTPSFKTTVSK